MPVLEELGVAQRERPRADQAHLPVHDVDDLRHLVEREPAQHAADPRHAWIVADLEQGAGGLVRRLEPCLVVSGVGDHGAELEHPELALTDPDPAVDVEDRPARVELDRQRDQKPERQPDDEQRRADDRGRRPA